MILYALTNLYMPGNKMAGAEMRSAMGVAVFSGMIGVTLFGLFLTPLFYVLLRRLAGNRPLVSHGEQSME
nr:efflux RND transporter permease subunit [Aeromonas media]